MITEDCEVKIIDFGFGKVLQGRKGTGFMSTFVGTEMYMAPEVLNKLEAYQGQDADIFALGVLMLTTKIQDYPWVKPDITKMANIGYKNLAADGGINDEQFWAKYADANASPEFKRLMSGMLAYQPSSRPTIADILGDPWMRGPVMSKEDFTKICKPIVAKAVHCQKTEL